VKQEEGQDVGADKVDGEGDAFQPDFDGEAAE